jgi:hypothetical protein
MSRRLHTDRQAIGLALERGQDRVAQATSKADLVASTTEGHNRLPLTMSSRRRAGCSRRAPAPMRLEQGGGVPDRPHLLRVISPGGGRP